MIYDGLEDRVSRSEDRQKKLADFGVFALTSTDLDDILTKACDFVSKAVGADLAKILEIQDGGRSLFVRAGVGWQPGIIGRLVLPVDKDTSETYAIASGEPVITNDIRKDERFVFPQFMVDAGVLGSVNVPILLPGGKPYGLLEVDSRDTWAPSITDTTLLRTYATILGLVIDRLAREREIGTAEGRSEILLRELQHRVKNDISAVVSLVKSRLSSTKSPEARSELIVVGDRVEVFRLVHDHLYRNRNRSVISLYDYCKELMSELIALHTRFPVQHDLHIENVQLTGETAFALGLIINEFTTNSLKYAFPTNWASDRLIVVEARQKDGRVWVKLRDNGVGFSTTGRKERSSGSGSGLGLIEGLSRQIGASPIWETNLGTMLSLDFPNQR